jgi:iron-sulfur cluster repair protein YtfE (RIC family)
LSKLVEEFRKEHENILEQLMAVKRMGIHTMEGRNQLMAVKQELLSHLEKEDQHLYPDLDKAAETDHRLKALLEDFEDEMKAFTSYCIEFFEKYSIQGGGIDFFRDFDKLKSALERRIDKEENLLFARYLEIYPD